MWRIMSGSTRSPDSVRRTPSSHAARPESSCIHRTRKRSASRRIPLSLPLSPVRAQMDGGCHRRQLGSRSDPWRRQREHDGAALEDLLIGQPVLACLGEHPQRHRGARHPVPTGVGEHAHQDLVGVQGPKDGVAAVEQCDQLAARELGQCGHRLQVRVGTIEQALGEDGQRRAEPTHPPCTAQLAQAGDRAQLLPDAVLRFDLPGEAEVDRDMAGDVHDHVAVVDLLAALPCRRAAPPHAPRHAAAAPTDRARARRAAPGTSPRRDPAHRSAPAAPRGSPSSPDGTAAATVDRRWRSPTRRPAGRRRHARRHSTARRGAAGRWARARARRRGRSR